VDEASKTAVPVDVGTAVFQLEAVCHVESVAPVHVWAFAPDATPRREAITAVIRTHWQTLEIRT
jgi:hypothetical protein